MKTFVCFGVLFGILLGIGVMVSESALAANTRVTYPSAFVGEVGGRGLLWSVAFDRVIDEHFAAGIGFGTVSTQFADGTSANTTATLIPFYATYYFMNDGSSLFATAGADIVANNSSVEGLQTSPAGVVLNNTPILATVGVGYENRSDTGFLFRIAGYGVMGSKFYPWAGLSVGYGF